MALECRHVRERIYDYLDGLLDGELLAKVQSHLQHCGRCSTLLESRRNILVLTADGRVYQLPPGLSERLHARLDEELSGM